MLNKRSRKWEAGRKNPCSPSRSCQYPWHGRQRRQLRASSALLLMQAATSPATLYHSNNKKHKNIININNQKNPLAAFYLLPLLYSDLLSCYRLFFTFSPLLLDLCDAVTPYFSLCTFPLTCSPLLPAPKAVPPISFLFFFYYKSQIKLKIHLSWACKKTPNKTKQQFDVFCVLLPASGSPAPKCDTQHSITCTAVQKRDSH